MTCSWLDHDLLITCSWLVHNLFMTASWLVHNLFITCWLLVHNLFMSNLWLVHNLFLTCFCSVYSLFITCWSLVLNLCSVIINISNNNSWKIFWFQTKSSLVLILVYLMQSLAKSQLKMSLLSLISKRIYMFLEQICKHIFSC